MIPSNSSILVATDLSASSFNTLKYALSCIRDNDSQIHILHVTEPMSDDAKITLMMFMQDKEQRKGAIDQRSELMGQEFMNKLDAFWASQPAETQALRGRVISTDIKEGFPAEVILQHAKKRECDLIMLGAHEQAISHSFLGTVAKRVLRRAEVPTMVVPYRRPKVAP
ncbi:universal stress protein [Leucothrix sargassi]|nr:universal stress protein [Leucothrix sargassi]